MKKRERENRRKNIIIFGLIESDKPKPETRREEDFQKMVGLCRNICKIDITSRDVRKAVRLGKAIQNNERPLLIVQGPYSFLVAGTLFIVVFLLGFVIVVVALQMNCRMLREVLGDCTGSYVLTQ